jgi:hypothetical protein
MVGVNVTAVDGNQAAGSVNVGFHNAPGEGENATTPRTPENTI